MSLENFITDASITFAQPGNSYLVDPEEVHYAKVCETLKRIPGAVFGLMGGSRIQLFDVKAMIREADNELADRKRRR